MWFAWLGGGVLFFLSWNISAPPAEMIFSDFHQAYMDAAYRLVSFGPIITWPVNDTCTEGFVNIPVLGWLFTPLTNFRPAVAALVFLAAGFAVLAAALALLARHFGMSRWQVAGMIAVTLANGPLVHGLREGNTTHFVLALTVLAVVMLRSGYPTAGGTVLGLCAMLKLPLLLLGVYFIIARRWRAATAFVATCGAIVAASLLVFGTQINLAWFTHCVTPFMTATMPGFNVQSLENFLFHLVNGPEHLHTWFLVPTGIWARAARFVVSCGLLLGALWLLALPRPPSVRDARPALTVPRELIEFNLVLAIAVVASPLSWSHYYVLLLLPWILYFVGAFGPSLDRATRWLMGLGAVLSSTPVLMLPKDLGALTPVLSRTVVFACFIGGVSTVAALVRCLWLERRREAAMGFDLPFEGWLYSARRLLFAERRDLSRTEIVTRGLGALLMATASIGVVMWLLSPAAYSDIGLQHTLRFFKGLADDDSWGPMADALRYLEYEYLPPHSNKPLYRAVVFDIGDKYQYPPFALFVAAWLRSVNAWIAPFLSPATAISWLAIAATAGAVFGIFETALRRAAPEARNDGLVGIRAALAIALTLTFYPVVKSFTLGQIQTWINAAITVAILAWMQGWKTPAGLLVGACALIKPHYAILILWATMCREWRFVAGSMTVTASGTLYALFTIGWVHHADYLRLLTFLSQHGESFYPNQSVNGLLNRLMSLSDPVAYNNVFWSESTFPPYTWWVHALTTASAVVILGLAMVRTVHTAAEDRTIDLCIVILSCTLASPIAWEHHYGVLMPIFAVLAPLMLNYGAPRLWIVAAYVLSSQYIPLTRLLAATPFNVLQSYLLFGALLTLLCLYGMRETPRAPKAVAP